MDASGNIYEIPEDKNPEPDPVVTKEDVARLEGFLKGRAEADRARREKHLKRHETLVWDSAAKGTYRKSDHIAPAVDD